MTFFRSHLGWLPLLEAGRVMTAQMEFGKQSIIYRDNLEEI
jgi:hypothetical protein